MPPKRLAVRTQPRERPAARLDGRCRRFRALSLTGRAGDTIPLGHKTLRVVGIRDDEADQPPVLVVEEAREASALRGESEQGEQASAAQPARLTVLGEERRPDPLVTPYNLLRVMAIGGNYPKAFGPLRGPAWTMARLPPDRCEARPSAVPRWGLARSSEPAGHQHPRGSA